ncbi:sugar transferase [Halobacillus massiliensis]|uniref:sugar transferase n=1 Tax=Halobacillus massiliensis TaxID=1926286 RepID=UPI0009E519A4|nr:sugar transferase [Halobacillus massiliensis]
MNNLQKRTESPFAILRKPFHSTLKRLFDIIVSIFSLLILSPIFIILSLFIIVEDGFPIFFKQRRSGLNDNEFKMYKFRSMINKPSAKNEKTTNIYNWVNGVPDEFVFKTSSETNPNITKIGSFIRKYSLDELPQFYNVLKGEMSIIGPRPEIIEITRCYNSVQKRRLSVKPGITGMAQVNGRSDINHGEKIAFDLLYVDNFSIWLDLKIFYKTIIQVFTGKGSV